MQTCHYLVYCSLTPLSNNPVILQRHFENIVDKGENADKHDFLLFYPIRSRNHNFGNIKFVVCKCFEFGLAQKIVIWYRVKEHLTLFQMTNFRLFQIERVCK